ncbi:MAG: DUF4330 family protein [Planctomycetes bacterium]|nr:DUF4330 family protein [Planctomycetota bacterium]
MPILDESGRLFGKVNVIDLAVLGVVAVVAATLAVRWYGTPWGPRPVSNEAAWVPVEIEIVVDPTVVESLIRKGSTQSAGSGTRIAARIVEVVPRSYRELVKGDPLNGDRRVLLVTIRVMARGYPGSRWPSFGARPVMPGALFRFEAEEYAFEGYILNLRREGVEPP